ncbi:hypothetical protein CBR_g56524 [Chara braunii]|uniref:Uncharacterized protein n=1 Tax=Chara braunii TaxID=69332 RepID=A0A388MDR4_CHABU|nr:hypothetical protein CBR_g56524 [Chara braunii]|eukprot:GBG92619.1 hypothetical protein CBR_g56524 [Chara braunii]
MKRKLIPSVPQSLSPSVPPLLLLGMLVQSGPLSTPKLPAKSTLVADSASANFCAVARPMVSVEAAELPGQDICETGAVVLAQALAL